MRKFFAILGIMLFGGLLYVYLTFFYERSFVTNEDTSVMTDEQILDDILTDDKNIEERVKELQENPRDISEFNSSVTKSVYGKELTDEELMKVVAFQYSYFDDALKEANDVDTMFKKTKLELEEYAEVGLKVIGFEALAPQYVEDDKYMSYIQVKYHTNATDEDPDELESIYMGYIFRKDKDGLWKLFGFDNIDQFTVIK